MGKKEQNRAYYLKNKQKLNARSRARYAANPSGCLAQSRACRAKKRRQYIDKTKAYGLIHAAELKAYRKRWADENPQRVRFSVYRKSARARGIAFELTREQFISFWNKPCYYSGKPIKTIGLDRINSAHGYTMDNVVPCCAEVNRAKGTMGREDYILLCKLVAERHG